MEKGYQEACFSFRRDAVSGAALAELIELGIGFEPTHIRIKPPVIRGGRCTVERLLTALRRCETVTSLHLTSSAGMDGPKLTVAPWYGCTVLWLTISWFRPLGDHFFLAMTRIPGFGAGYLTDAEDDYWQNVESPSAYEIAGRSYAHLGLVGTYPVQSVDVSKNPGHRFEIPGLLVGSSWRMWFSRLAEPFLPLERIRKFSAAYRCEELPGEILFMELYPNGQDPSNELARGIQSDFRAWMGMPKLEAAAPGLLGEAADPVYEISNGTLDGKPVALFVTWLAADGQHVQKSIAEKRWVALQWQDGTRIWACIQTPPYEDIEISAHPPSPRA